MFFTEKKLQSSNLQETVITTPERNLRSKIDSLLRSLENLTSKKLRIEYEIKKQKRSLERKRSELKKSNKTVTRRYRLSLENQTLQEAKSSQEIQEFLREDQLLLQKSSQMLDD